MSRIKIELPDGFDSDDEIRIYVDGALHYTWYDAANERQRVRRQVQRLVSGISLKRRQICF